MFDDIHRIINLRIIVQDYHFDAAIDCNWFLHCYGDDVLEELAVPIELYNLDKPDWDIKVIKCTAEDIRKYEPTFGLKKNAANSYEDNRINYKNSSMCHTFVSFNFIYDAIVQWIKEHA